MWNSTRTDCNCNFTRSVFVTRRPTRVPDPFPSSSPRFVAASVFVFLTLKIFSTVSVLITLRLLWDGPLTALKSGPLSVCLFLISKAYKGESSDTDKQDSLWGLRTDKTCEKHVWLTCQHYQFTLLGNERSSKRRSIKSKTRPKNWIAGTYFIEL